MVSYFDRLLLAYGWEGIAAGVDEPSTAAIDFAEIVEFKTESTKYRFIMVQSHSGDLMVTIGAGEEPADPDAGNSIRVYDKSAVPIMLKPNTTYWLKVKAVTTGTGNVLRA